MRVFLERRLVEVESTLALAQESLRSYQERYRMVSVDQETKAAIDAYATLKSQAYLKQAEFEAVSSAASSDNPFVLSLRRELDAYQDQLRKLETGGGTGGFGVGFAVSFEQLPARAAEFARRYRDYRIQEEAYAMLSQQYEYAKVLEARDAPTLTVLDYAVPPQKKSAPKRALIVLAAFLFSLTAGVTLAFLLEYHAFVRRERPGEYAYWAAVGDEVSQLTRRFRRLLIRRKGESKKTAPPAASG
jgi:capsule polysaccharide export protein KpsE/RkpR